MQLPCTLVQPEYSITDDELSMRPCATDMWRILFGSRILPYIHMYTFRPEMAEPSIAK